MKSVVIIICALLYSNVYADTHFVNDMVLSLVGKNKNQGDAQQNSVKELRNSVICSVKLKSDDVRAKNGISESVVADIGWDKQGVFHAKYRDSSQTKISYKLKYTLEQDNRPFPISTEKDINSNRFSGDEVIDYFTGNPFVTRWDSPEEQVGWFSNIGFNPKKKFDIVQSINGKIEKHACLVTLPKK